MRPGSLGIVEEWLNAVNRADGGRLEALTTEQVEIIGPRGAGVMDRGVLSRWLTRAGFSATSMRWFCGGNGSVVVEQDAQWRDVATGTVQVRARVASRFLVTETGVARYVRHDDGLESALAAAGLTHRDEVTERQAPEGPAARG